VPFAVIFSTICPHLRNIFFTVVRNQSAWRIWRFRFEPRRDRIEREIQPLKAAYLETTILAQARFRFDIG
jgi:hypothetical protein